MYKAVITIRPSRGEEYSDIIQHERQDVFYAMVTGSVIGATAYDSVVSHVEILERGI